MGNYTQLISVPNTSPISIIDGRSRGVRSARNIIPLFWWGLFEENDLAQYEIDIVDSSGASAKTQIWTLLKERDGALESLKNFAIGLSYVKGMPEQSLECFRAFIEEIHNADGRALQLEASELLMLLDPKEFENLVSDGCRFGSKVRAGRLKQSQSISEELLEFAGVFKETIKAPTESVPFDKDDFTRRVAEIAVLPLPKPQKRRAEIFLESMNWEHSLIGFKATSVADAPAECLTPSAARPWWQFWE